jgi:hypothetical protein
MPKKAKPAIDRLRNAISRERAAVDSLGAIGADILNEHPSVAKRRRAVDEILDEIDEATSRKSRGSRQLHDGGRIDITSVGYGGPAYPPGPPSSGVDLSNLIPNSIVVNLDTPIIQGRRINREYLR